ncbi:MAG: hypothetical protein DI539_11980 [Flavobacterium psychrophilum]|nr:MAG: hypothetical protein DI539_11980 [Flavobacterium psychrophilum]
MENSKPKVIGVAPQLLVPDVKMTAEYYRDILGFNIIGYALNPPVYGMIERDGIQIHFAKSDEFLTNDKFRPSTTDLILWIPEIDAFYAEIKTKGADIVQEILLRPYGSREFIIRDCNGYKILIGD